MNATERLNQKIKELTVLVNNILDEYATEYYCLSLADKRKVYDEFRKRLKEIEDERD